MWLSRLWIGGAYGELRVLRLSKASLIMKLAFESQDFLIHKCELQKRVSCEPRVLSLWTQSPVISPAFKFQHSDVSHCFFKISNSLISSLCSEVFFESLLTKRNHFGHIGGVDPNFLFSLRKTVLAFTGTNEERQARLIKGTTSTLRELISDGRFDLWIDVYSKNQYSFSRKPLMKMRRFCLTGTISGFVKSKSVASSSLTWNKCFHYRTCSRYMEWDLVKAQSGVANRRISCRP